MKQFTHPVLSRSAIARAVQKAAATPDPQTRQQKISEERRRLWDAIARFVHDNGGWVTSIPHTSPIRIEAGINSNLQDKLAEHGCPAIYRYRETRIVGDTFHVRNVFELSLPKA